MKALDLATACRLLIVGAGLLLPLHGASAQAAPVRPAGGLPPPVVAVQLAENGTARHNLILPEAGPVELSGTAERG